MLEARGLMVFFENLLTLNEVDLDCGAGSIVGVFGANGAGKSTLMRTLSGLLLDERERERVRGGERISVFGEIRLDGERVDRLPAHRRVRRGVVLCPERRRLFGESSVLENLRIGAHTADRASERRTLEAVWDLFPALVALRLRPAGLLSGGEQQMVAIGRALMAQPRVLLLDEPLLGLAPAVQRAVVEALPAIRARGVAMVITEQFARPLLGCVDHRWVLQNGSLARLGPSSDDGSDLEEAYLRP